MEQLRQDSLLSVSRQSTGFFEEDVEELSTVRSSTLVTNNDPQEAIRLSARLVGYGALPGVGAIVETPPIISPSAVTAWKSHLSELTSLEKQMFLDHSKGDLVQYIKEIDGICQKQGDASKGRKIAKIFRPWFGTMNQYAPIAQTMIQADPTSSSLLLGGITCIMSISERYLDFPEQISELLADMGEKIDILTKYGSEIYRNNDSVQGAIIEIFGDVLKFCRLALPLFKSKDGKDRNSAHAFLKALKTSFQGYFGDIKKKYEADLRVFEDRAKLCDRWEEREYRSIQAEVLRYQMTQTMHLGQVQDSAIASGRHFAASQIGQMKMIESIRRKDEEEKAKETLREKIIAWLEQTSIKFHADQNKKMMDRLEDTGTWIVKHEKYTLWKDKSESELLWVNGKRGCGKSFLTSVVVQDLKATCESVENLKKGSKEKSAFAFIYCTSLETDKYDLSKLLCSLLEQLSHQLPKPAVDPYLKGIYERHGGSRPLDFDEIKRALESLLGRFKKTYLVIDGLDELRILKHEQFEAQCRYFRKLTQSRNDDCAVKLVAFSRPEYLVISNAFDGCPQIPIDDGANHEDIEKFISMKLTSTGLHFKPNPDLLKDIKQELLSRAEGMFLWVDLVTNSLKDEYTATGLRQKVKDLPRGLDLQYTTSLQKIVNNENIRDMALKILLWITNARRPLGRAELLEALVVQPGMTKLGDEDKIFHDANFCRDCENLIVLDRANETYQLLHSSLRDYLMAETDKVDVPEKYRALQKNADKILGETCLTYLNFDQFEKGSASSIDDVKHMMEANPFLGYASIHWGRHVAAVQDAHLHDLARNFVTVSERRDLSMQLLILTYEERSALFAGPSTPLHILAIFDLVGVASTMTDLNTYHSQADGFSAIPLDYALLYGSRQMCNQLLVGIQDLNTAEDKPTCRCIPIHAAASNGWDEVVRSLIDLGYDAEFKFGDEEVTAFHVAAIQGSTDVLDVLLEKGVNKDAQDVDGSTPLLRACEANNSSFAGQLINAGANVTLSGWNGTTPLHHAAKNGQFELVKTLLQKGADKNAACSESWGFRTPLHLAAEEGASQVLHYLIEEGADIDAIGPEGFTALHLSCAGGYLECLRALLKARARVDLLTEDGRSAIHLAAGNGHLDVLTLLFDQRTEECAKIIDKPDNDDDVALHYAAFNGHLETANFLIKKGAIRDTGSISKQSPIHDAIVKGNTDVAKLFLETDPTCVTWKGTFDSPTLHYVAHYGAKYPALNDLIIPLLEAKAEPEITNGVGQRAIHFAIKAGNLQFADVLLERVPNLELNALSERRQTPMYLAAADGIYSSVEWLLDKKVPLEQPKTEDDNSPCHISAWNGHIQILKKLLTPENVNDPGFKGRTALFGASARGHYDIAKYLLENNADPNITDEYKQTPLIICIRTNHIEVANLLLDWKADPNISTTEGRVAFHEACITGDEALVRRLLQANCDPLYRDRFGQTPFKHALTCTNPAILKILTEHKIDGWRIADNCGTTCLHMIADFGSVSRLECYKDIFSTEDFKAVDEIGRNALWYAAQNGHSDMLEVLLDLGVPLQGADDSPRGPLHEAADKGFVDAVQELIKLRHNIVPIDEPRDLHSETALHAAASSHQPLVAGILLQAGANPFLQDDLGLTALDYMIRHPRPLGEAALSDIDYTCTEMKSRMPRLKATAQQMLQKILNLPDKFASKDEYYRAASLCVLAAALLEMDTKESVERALVCYLELATPGESSAYSITWICGMCGKRNPSGPKYMCPQSRFASVLCDVCYPEYEKGDGSPKCVPKSVQTLEGLQKQLKPAQQALAPFVSLGSRFIVPAWNLLKLSAIFLDEKKKEYDEWIKSHNIDGRFDDRTSTDLKFLAWLQTAIKTHAEQTEKETKRKKVEKRSDDDTKGGSEPIFSDSALGTTTEEKIKSEKDPFESLDRELYILFKDSRSDKELMVFACDGHEFLKIPTMDTASEKQKKCFGEDGRLAKDWLRELGEWFEKFPIQIEAEKPAKDDQTNSGPQNGEISAVASEVNAATDLAAIDMSASGSLLLIALTEGSKRADKDATTDNTNTKDGKGTTSSDEKASNRKASDEKADTKVEISREEEEKVALLSKIRQNLLIDLVEDLNTISRSNIQPHDTDELVAEPEEIQAPGNDQNAAETKPPSELGPKAESGSTMVSSQSSEATVTAADDSKSPNSTAARTETGDAGEDVLHNQRMSVLLVHEASWRLAQAMVLGVINQITLGDLLERINSDENENVEETEEGIEEQNDQGGRIDVSAIGGPKDNDGIADDTATTGAGVKEGNVDGSTHLAPVLAEDSKDVH